jgi:hypothetical protein
VTVLFRAEEEVEVEVEEERGFCEEAAAKQ